MRTNEASLVRFAVQGTVMYPRSYGWEVSRTGQPMMLPSVGGITYNVKVGDSVFGLAGDHIEPAVSFTSDPTKLTQDPNRGFNIFSCIGNEAVIISGDAKGEKGMVTGHHGGVEHVLADFPDHALEKLTHDDKVLIRAFGQGLRLLDYPEVHCFSLDPSLLKKLGLHVAQRGQLEVPVTAIVPGKLMGSGLGHSDVFKGDYDIQTSDMGMIREHRLDRLRFGDIVAILDHDSSFGWSYRTGAVSIGVVVHGDSQLAGHGPGVQTLLSSKEGLFSPVIRSDANIGFYLNVGRWRAAPRRAKKPRD
ncbi:MAG: DUF4438 domain-containing protein [Nitrospirae bacterium]|nr:DUF4438 domain-containing protein [Candidatus Manganitrophaceae bacterium]